MKKTNNIKVKQVGKFVVSYRGLNNVAISFMGRLGCLSTQMVTHEMVDGFLTPTGTYCNIHFEGFCYPGINFRIPLFMSRKKLENLLKNAK